MAAQIVHACRCSHGWRRQDRVPARTFDMATHSEARLTDGPEARKGTSLPAPYLIAGTWDFKWPQGHVIRVAFQDGPHPRFPQLDDVIQRVQLLAETWTKSKGEPTTSVQFDFLPEKLPAPRNPDVHGSVSPADKKARVYDVLISLAPLPTFEPETPGDPRVEIEAATSQLGSYALRSDYGVPTTYLGLPAGFGDPRVSLEARQAEYFGSPLFEFVVAHECGHILGLAHEHQNPRLTGLKLKSNDEIRQIMREVWRLPPGHELLSDQYIDSEIKLRWPGGHRFSDWREPEKSLRYGNESIMAHALFRYFVQGGPEGRSQQNQQKQEQYGDATSATAAAYSVELTRPTDSDLAHLAQMYPLRRTIASKYARAESELPREDGETDTTAP